jgi:hypothetical protein
VIDNSSILAAQLVRGRRTAENTPAAGERGKRKRGPSSCRRTRTVVTSCSRCGQTTDCVDGRTHVPIKTAGWFCERCCPNCNAMPKEAISGGFNP